MAIEIESTYDLLDIDLVRATPDIILMRLVKVTNAIVVLLQRQQQNAAHRTGMPKSDPMYADLNRERYVIEADLKSVTTKFENLTQMLYAKNAEMRMIAKSHFG